jgi:hypothetical protein
MIIPTHQAWLKQTNAGTFKPRSSELKAIDALIDAYHKANSPYGKEWNATELRIALDKWKKKKGADWQTDDRNKHGMIASLDAQLPAPKISSGSAEGNTAKELRQAVLYFLANASTSPVPSNMMDFLQDGTDTSSDLQSAIQTGISGGGRMDKSAFYDKANKGGSFASDLVDKMIGYVKDLAGYFATAAKALGIADVAQQAAEFVIRGLPDLLVQVLGGLLSKVTTVVAVIKGLAQAGTAAVAIWRSRDCSKGILSGGPREIVDSVRQQIKEDGYKGVKDTLKAAVLAGLSAIPGAGDVVGAIASAIASVYAFVTKVFDHFREMGHLKKVIKEAKANLAGKLYDEAPNFQIWFKKTIAFLPIVSSYCMCLPLTGSYYGFLTLVSADGSQLSYKELERNYGMFSDVKKWAKKFVEEHSVKLFSANKVVQHSISSARGEKGVWDTMSGGAVDRSGKIAMGMIEKALS